MSEVRGTPHKDQYWFNVATGEVEHGRQSPWQQRLGPYATPEEAARALETARRRTEDWDDEDERWRSTTHDEEPQDGG